ncbi:unnamed protein product [Sphagnum jensenii]
MRRRGSHIFPGRLHGGANLVAVTVHCEPRQHLHLPPENSPLTSFLQEHRLVRKHSALVPRHPISQIIQLDLFAPLTLPHPRRRHLGFSAIPQRNLHHGPSSLGAPRVFGIVHVVVFEEAASAGRGRRRLHLQREPGARVDGVALAEGVGDLVDVHGVERDAHAHPASLARVIDEDELSLLGLGNVAEQRAAIVLFRLGAGDDGVRAARHGRARIVHGRGHGGAAYGGIGRVAPRVAGEDVTLTDVVGGSGDPVRSGVVVMVALVHVIFVAWSITPVSVPRQPAGEATTRGREIREEGDNAAET